MLNRLKMFMVDLKMKVLPYNYWGASKKGRDWLLPFLKARLERKTNIDETTLDHHHVSSLIPPQTNRSS